MKRWSWLLAGMAFIWLGEPAHAQWRTIAACPGAVALYPASATGVTALIDVNGNICISGTIATTPSGTQDTNIAQILGAVPSLTNPLWIFPATGATFPVSGTVSANSILAAETTKVIGTVNQGTSPWVVSGAVTSTPGSQYPSGATPITASATGTTGATTATLAAASTKSTYLCGFTITSDATAAVAGTATVTGPIGGTMSFIQNVGAATAAGILTQTFNPCIPSSTTNTAIAVNSVAAGVGGNTAVVAWGFQL